VYLFTNDSKWNDQMHTVLYKANVALVHQCLTHLHYSPNPPSSTGCSHMHRILTMSNQKFNSCYALNACDLIKSTVTLEQIMSKCNAGLSGIICMHTISEYIHNTIVWFHEFCELVTIS